MFVCVHMLYTSLLILASFVTGSSIPLSQDQQDTSFNPSLFRLSDESGSLEFSLVSEGSFSRSNLDPNDGR